MSTPKLLWNMIARGCGRTTGIGALLGAGYGIVLLATAMFLPGQFNWSNAQLPLFFVLVYAALIAALFGAVVAAVIGFVSGPIGGFLCGLMTRFFFMPLRDARAYRIVAAIAGGLYGGLALIVAIRLISTSGFAPPIVTWQQALMLYVIPAALGGVAGTYISRHVIDVYRQEIEPAGTAKPLQKPTPAAKPV